jgi:16S rRNA (guanine527-N7)-methyltransferase
MDLEIKELVAGARGLGIEIGPVQQRQFQDYADLLLEWNRRMNLVRVRGREELMRAHMLDSLWCSSAIDLRGNLRMLDIGSGAGFPGIPLRICFPELKLFLLESQQKRSLFLAEAIRRLGLDNSMVLTGRAEELARKETYRESFACVVARAVAPMTVLAELAIPFVAKGGQLIALKGGTAEEEIAGAAYAVEQVGGVIERVIPYRFPGENGRSVISIKKVVPTPERYPRRSGIPAKRPLLEKGACRKNDNGVEGVE